MKYARTLFCALAVCAAALPLQAVASGCSMQPSYSVMRGVPIHLADLLALKPKLSGNVVTDASNHSVGDDQPLEASLALAEALEGALFTAQRSPKSPDRFVLDATITLASALERKKGAKPNQITLQFTPQPPKLWTTVHRSSPDANEKWTRDYLIQGKLSVVADSSKALARKFSAEAQLVLYGEGQACFDGVYAFMLNVSATPKTPSIMVRGGI